MAKHILVDTETLGVGPNSVVISLGAVAFDLVPGGENNYASYVLNGFYAKFSIREQIETYRRRTEEGTLGWWREQSPEAREVLRPSDQDVTMIEGLELFNQWIKADTTEYKWNDSYVWCRGNAFDFPKIETMYEQAGVKCGFNTWKIRDVRTYIDILTGDTRGKYNPRETPQEFVAHHALHDAAMDAYRMVEIFNNQFEE